MTDDKKVENSALSNLQLIQPFFFSNSGSRATMVSAHLTQFIPLVNSEVPNVMSTYAHMIGSLNKKIYKTNMTIIQVVKYLGKKYFLFYDWKNKRYDLVVADYVINETGFSSEVNVNVTDIPIGDPKNDMVSNVYHTSEIDESGLPSFGLNANVAYMMFNDNFEDAIVISESFAKRSSHYEIDEIEFIVNKNEFLTRYNNGHCFPKVNESVNENSHILCVKRKINKNFSNFLSQNDNTSYYLESDELFFSEGTVMSIDVLSNFNREKQVANDFILDDEPTAEDTFNKELFDYETNTKNDLKHFYETVKRFVYDEGHPASELLAMLFLNTEEMLFSTKPIIYNDKIFDGFLVKIKVKRLVPTQVGSKLTSLHASKGLVSVILKDEEMPTTSDGKPLDIIFNVNSVVGRLNYGQVNELIVNNIGKKVAELIRQETDHSKKNEILAYYLENMVFDKDILMYFHRNMKEFIESIDNGNPIKIAIDPTARPSRLNYKALMERFNIRNEQDLFLDGEKIGNQITTGSIYIIKLKHEPQHKMSFVSLNKLNEITRQPAKDKSKKAYKSPFNYSPSIIGEMEFNILLTEQNHHILKELIYVKSANSELRDRYLVSIINNEPLYQDELFENVTVTHPGVDILSKYLKVLSLEFS